MSAIYFNKFNMRLSFYAFCAAAWLTGQSALLAQIQAALQAQPAQPVPVQMWILQGQSEDDYRERFITSGKQKLVSIQRVLASAQEPLTAEQHAKLKLAIEGIASRALHDVSEYRAMTDDLNMNNPNDQQKAIEILQPAMVRAQDGSFGRKSLYWQYVESTLTTSQKSVLTERENASRQRRHRAISLKTIEGIDGRLLLVKEQRDQLVKLMDEVELPEMPENYEQMAGIFKLVRLMRDEKLKFLDADQQKQLETLTAPYQNLEGAIQ